MSNLLAVRLGAATFPLPEHALFQRLQLGTDFFVFSKFLKNAPIDEPTGDQRFLGVEPDLYLNWQVSSDVTFALRYGIFFPSERNFTRDDSRQFLYAGLTFSF